MSDKDNNKLIVSVLGLEKLFGPTMEYAGEQLLELVKYIVERAKKRLHEKEKSEFFQSIPGRSTYLILENGDVLNGLPVESAKSINPFAAFPEWYWPLLEKGSNNYIDQILCEVDKDVDRIAFVNMLCQSLSLNQQEKQRVIDAWPILSQFQIDELQKVFIKERRKFEEELFHESPRDVWSLVYTRMQEWAVIVLKDRRIGLESFLIPPLNGEYLFPYFALWPEFWQKNGVLLMDEVKDYRSASRAFQQACYLSPESAFSWVRLGYCYVRLRYFDFALKCFWKTIELKPSNKVLLLDICELYVLKDDLEEAKKSIEGIYDKLQPEYFHVFMALSWIIEVFDKGRWINPSDDLNNFVGDIDSESTWYWVDLKDHVLNASNIDDVDKKNVARYIQRLIALTV